MLRGSEGARREGRRLSPIARIRSFCDYVTAILRGNNLSVDRRIYPRACVEIALNGDEASRISLARWLVSSVIIARNIASCEQYAKPRGKHVNKLIHRRDRRQAESKQLAASDVKGDVKFTSGLTLNLQVVALVSRRSSLTNGEGSIPEMRMETLGMNFHENSESADKRMHLIEKRRKREKDKGRTREADEFRILVTVRTFSRTSAGIRGPVPYE